MTRTTRSALAGLVLAALTAPSIARAGDFDDLGHFSADPFATVVVDFGEGFDPQTDRYVPDDADEACLAPAFELVEADDALLGPRYARVNTQRGCAERFVVRVPPQKGSYRASLWMRHGAADVQLTVRYPQRAAPLDASREGAIGLRLAPTGRVTSDGWVELTSNALPFDAGAATVAHITVSDYDEGGTEIDAIELVPAGAYWESRACAGLGDPVCGEGALCVHNACRLEQAYVPPLPGEAIRDGMVEVMKGKLSLFFGGRKTRLDDLPDALAILEATREAPSAWAFWNGWARAVARLHDWHTRISGPIGALRRRARMAVCFFEGDADLSRDLWPSDARYKDILVSHANEEGGHGLRAGDRLVAVDGLHPIEWALTTAEVDWGHWRASDSNVYTELAESMRGLLLAYATTFQVIHCDAEAGTCGPEVRTLAVADLPTEGGGQPNCDNRPFYHLQGEGNQPNANHNVHGNFFRGRVAETTEEEAIYGLVWDTLYGGGSPSSSVNQNIFAAIADFKDNARGVILDHRAGSGGTLDAAENVTRLVRPSQSLLVMYSPLPVAGFDGPTTAEEGVLLFERFVATHGMRVGAADYAADLPVALITHRAGSASDFMALGMKGAPRVRLFAPHATAGAFSTFHELFFHGAVSINLASGDAITSTGEARLGHGVEPDEVVVPRQSDLLAGKDTLHEAALAWVRQELSP